MCGIYAHAVAISSIKGENQICNFSVAVLIFERDEIFLRQMILSIETYGNLSLNADAEIMWNLTYDRSLVETMVYY